MTRAVSLIGTGPALMEVKRNWCENARKGVKPWDLVRLRPKIP